MRISQTLLHFSMSITHVYCPVVWWYYGQRMRAWCWRGWGGQQRSHLCLLGLLKNASLTGQVQVPLCLSTSSNRTPSSSFLYNNRSVCTSITYRGPFMLRGVYELRRERFHSVCMRPFMSHKFTCRQPFNIRQNNIACHVPSFKVYIND